MHEAGEEHAAGTGNASVCMHEAGEICAAGTGEKQYLSEVSTRPRASSQSPSRCGDVLLSSTCTVYFHFEQYPFPACRSYSLGVMITTFPSRSACEYRTKEDCCQGIRLVLQLPQVLPQVTSHGLCGPEPHTGRSTPL